MERIDKVIGTFGRHNKKEVTREDVSLAVIRRLPRYHRYLGELLRENHLRISSAELSAMMGITASQIRQDLNCFGGFGQQGYGYNVKYLYGKISELLGVNEGYSAVIVGAGNLGRALVSSHMFERRGINRLAMFDVDDSLVGTSVAGIPILHVSELENFCRENSVAIGVLTTPKDEAHKMALRLVDSGVLGLWNFSNMELKLPDCPDVTIQNMHIGDSLMTLCYQMASKKKQEER